MGIPYNMVNRADEGQKSLSIKILIAANYLISEYKNIDSFLGATYDDLLNNTALLDFSEQDIISYGLNIMPESFAGLTSITQQKRLTKGMHLLIDIGGGTTDIAFFTITDNNLPNIHAVLSFPQGLNYIFEEYVKANHYLSVPDVEQLFRKKQQGFEEFISLFHGNLNDKAEKMIKEIENSFKKRQPIHGFHVKRLKNALSQRPVVYCGGGSLYEQMRIALNNFSDINLIDKDLLNIPYIKNENINARLFTILATSYGLSIQLEEEMEMTKIEEVFNHLPEKEKGESNDWRKEHGLSDT